MTLLRINAADFVVRGTEEQLGKYLENIRIQILSSFSLFSVWRHPAPGEHRRLPRPLHRTLSQ